jgi:plasmid stability protein
MSVQITIRNVSDEARKELAARAARRGMSMQEYLREELERLARRPSIDEWLAAVRHRKSLTGSRPTTESILAHRDADRQ